MAKHKKHKNWLKAIETDAEHLGDDVEKGMAETIKLAVQGTEFATKFALLPFTATLKLYKALKTKIKEEVANKKGKEHSDSLDEVDNVLNHQDAAIKINKKEKSNNNIYMGVGVLVLLIIIGFVISKSNK